MLDQFETGARTCEQCDQGWLSLAADTEHTSPTSPTSSPTTLRLRCPIRHADCDWAVAQRRHRLRLIGFGDQHLNVTLDQVRTPEARAAIGTYLAEIDANITAGKGLWLWGPVGTGKTSVLSILAQRMLRWEPNAGYRLALIDAAQLSRFEELRQTLEIDWWCRCPFLLYDDLGSEGRHDWILSTLLRIADERWRSGRATIVTTNIPYTERQRADWRPYARILDRWTDASRTTVVQLAGKGWRQ